MKILEERKPQVYRKGAEPFQLDCNKQSVAGSVSQRACVFCGSRVVLYPIADALHLVHGPLGCAAYTWDIRGALSSGPQLHRLSFSTDLREMDVIQGGEKKLAKALCQLIDRHQPKAAFVYCTCIVGVIGDDVEAVCRQVSAVKGIPVLPVHSEGFRGTKRDGYRAACEALLQLVGTGSTEGISPVSVNILGDFNLAGEVWIIRDYFERMGVEVVATITGDGRIDDIRRAHGAALNLVQCSGSMTHLAKQLQEKNGIPFKKVSYFGIEDMAQALYDTAGFFAGKSPGIVGRTAALVSQELATIMPQIAQYRRELEGHFQPIAGDAQQHLRVAVAHQAERLQRRIQSGHGYRQHRLRHRRRRRCGQRHGEWTWRTGRQRPAGRSRYGARSHAGEGCWRRHIAPDHSLRIGGEPRPPIDPPRQADHRGRRVPP